MMDAKVVAVVAVAEDVVVVEYILGIIVFGLWISDLMFPLWLAKWYGHGRNKGWSMAASWLLASGFVYVQAFVVAHTVGWNIGAYAMMIPSILLIEFFKPEYIEWSTLPKYQMLGMLYAVSLFWFVILPVTVLYFYQMKNNDTIQN